mmetsp:Transcript_81247/g.230604  ORF Transcript_81247/g.230604 Transcript_81247/m.230604 type:complete len:236 (-) Transcript_81247:1876-2583(-)
MIVWGSFGFHLLDARKWSTLHASHEAEPLPLVERGDEQRWQSSTALPLGENVPWGHGSHSLTFELSLPPSEYLPGPQPMQRVRSELASCPAEQKLHASRSTLAIEPASHRLQSSTPSCARASVPSSSLMVPSGHMLHSALPSATATFATGQTSHEASSIPLPVAENVPRGQPRQPCPLSKYSPATQDVVGSAVGIGVGQTVPTEVPVVTRQLATERERSATWSGSTPQMASFPLM